MGRKTYGGYWEERLPTPDLRIRVLVKEASDYSIIISTTNIHYRSCIIKAVETSLGGDLIRFKVKEVMAAENMAVLYFEYNVSELKDRKHLFVIIEK